MGGASRFSFIAHPIFHDKATGLPTQQRVLSPRVRLAMNSYEMLKVLRERFGIDPNDARSESWREFENVKFDFVITLCDKAREACPIWPARCCAFGSLPGHDSPGHSRQRRR